MMGYHCQIEELRMAVTEARGVQLCYGGFEKGDSDGPGYDWWQLLVVGACEPPFRAILAQSATREKLTGLGHAISSYLGVPWVDDGDFRQPVSEGEESDGGRLESGVYVTSCSSSDAPLDPELVREETARQSLKGMERFAVLFVLVVSVIGYFIWSASIREEEEQAARKPQQASPGVAEEVDLSELLANGAKYNAKKVRTSGYLRSVTFLMNHYGKDKHLALYAFSAEPIDLSKRRRGGVIGDVGVTNVIIHTTEFMDAAFTKGATTNTTPKRIIIGQFSFDGKYHNLVLSAWARDPDERL